MIRRILTLIAFILTGTIALYAQDIRFNMSAPTIVTMGEQFSLTLSLNEKGDDLQMPSLDNFTILMGPSVSSSQSISIINGKTTRSINYSYTYILAADKEGTFTISPASIKVDRKIYQSNAITIQVIKGRQQSGTSGSQTQSNQSIQSDEQASTTSRENLFLRFETDKRNVYKGEMISATLKLYSRINLSIADQTMPSFEGFWTQDLELPNAEQTRTREAVDGIIYNVYTLSKKILIPQQAGKLSIEPAEMIFNVQQRVAPQNVFDDFFGSYKTVRTKVSTDRITINVKDLPPAPSGFKGAVGEFSISSTIDKTDVSSNDAVTIKTVINGNGNLKHINPIEYTFPTDFEAYDPKTNYNFKGTDAGLFGSTSFEHLVIPRYAGEFTIPSVPFVYFNPKSGNYVTLRTNEFNLHVKKGADDGNSTVVSSISKEDVRFIGKDIRYIKQETDNLKLKNQIFFGSSWFYLSYLFAALGFTALVVWQRKKIRESADHALMKNKRASKMARKHLKAASNCVKTNNKDQFFEALLRAFWGYLSDKLTIPMADLSRDNARSTLQKYNVDETAINELMELVDICEMARYAPTAVHEEISDVYAKGEKLIEKFERQIRKKA